MELTRRAALRGGTLLAVGGLAGCLGGDSGETVDSLPAPTKGSADAAVTVQAFEDFACGHCRTFALEVLPEIESRYVESGEVSYEHRDFPLPVDAEWSWAAPSAARAVQDTVGDEAFFEFATGLYRNMDGYSMDLMESLAEEVGADPETVRTAAADVVYRPVLEADKSRGEEMGVTGTPMVFVDGTLADDYSLGTVSNLIDTKL